MAVTYNVVRRGEPGVPGGGELRYFAVAKTTGEIGIEEISELIEMVSTVSDIDIAGVLKGFIRVVPRELAKGKIARLGDFGSFRIGIGSAGYETEDAVTGETITRRRVIYTPGPVMKTTLSSLKFERIGNGE